MFSTWFYLFRWLKFNESWNESAKLYNKKKVVCFVVQIPKTKSIEQTQYKTIIKYVTDKQFKKKNKTKFSKQFYNREILRCQITVTTHKMCINVSYRRQFATTTCKYVYKICTFIIIKLLYETPMSNKSRANIILITHYN